MLAASGAATIRAKEPRASWVARRRDRHVFDSQTMTEQARKLLDGALPPTRSGQTSPRSFVVSLDGEPDEDVEQAWAEEIERRGLPRWLDPGGGTDWDIVHEGLRRQLRREQ